MNIQDKLTIALGLLKDEGIRSFAGRAYGYIRRNNLYPLWIKRHEKDINISMHHEYNPLISVIVPVYNVSDDMLTACIDSVLSQTYEHVELCLVDDCSTYENVRPTLESYAADKRVKIHYRCENGHISAATNDGLSMATGEYIGLLDCDDILSVNALDEVVGVINAHRDANLIYSDEDKISEDGRHRKEPFFKPDWSPDTLMSTMYTSHFSVYRRSLVESLGGMREGTEGCQDYDLALRVSEKTDAIYHIDKILYHWRERKGSTALNPDSKGYVYEHTKAIKEEALARRGLKGTLTYVPDIGQFQVTYDVQGEPKVSIIILSKDNASCFGRCINSIQVYTDYPHIEFILVDNGSSGAEKKEYIRLCKEHNIIYIYGKKRFNFSEMCNTGAAKGTGEYLLFMNDDIEIMDGDRTWLQKLVGHAALPHVGAVGAKLYYGRDGTLTKAKPLSVAKHSAKPQTGGIIQHCGLINPASGPMSAFYQMRDDIPYYYGRNRLAYNYSAVTGACMLIAKDKFREIGGFDEKLPVAYNDIDICFKLLEHGYHNVLRPDVAAYHYESLSRGIDKADRRKEQARQKALDYLYEKHPSYKGYDPCYSRNLVQTRGDFSLSI